MEKVLITGANGLIGKALSALLITEGYEVVQLLRKPPENSATKYQLWNPDKAELNETVFEGIQHVIHLAGSSIGEGRWTKARRKKIYDSRIKSAELLFEKSKNATLKTFVSAAGISIYGMETSEEIFDEESPIGTDFLAKVSEDWEMAADLFTARNIRVVKIRMPVVLSQSGGALEQIARPVKMGFGAVIGNGKHYFPWIHINDVCRIYLKSIQDDAMHGAYNAAAPNHCTNRELTAAIAKRLSKKIWLPPVPGFLLKIYFGEMANLILKGSRISSRKLEAIGFNFEYTNIQLALEDCL